MASFFDTLFGGGAEREAANRNRAQINEYGINSRGYLDTGLERASGALQQGRNSADALLQRNHGLYSDLRNTGTGILDRGRADSLAALNAAGSSYDPLANLGAKYGDATSLYLDSLGVKGADASRRAVNAFQAGPAYEFMLEQGLQALNRRRNAAGMLNSGNADIDALTYGTGLANQTYGDWQNRLQGFIDPELAATQGAATGRAGVSQAIADRIGQDTLARLGLEQAVTTGQAGVNTARAGNDAALGNSLAPLYTGHARDRAGVASNVASGNMAANNMQAQGEAQGARNLLNGAMSLATLAAGSIPGLGGSFGFGGGRQTGPTFANETSGMMGGVPFQIFR
jgi:hypothetical protein